jgi:hypothetical protein
MPYCDCGNELDQDCNGNARCDVCDPPCPCCSDGSIFDEEEDNIEDSWDADQAHDTILEHQEMEDFENHYGPDYEGD